MKYCPECGAKYENELAFCLKDGSTLVRNEDAETLKIRVPRSVENETVLIERKETIKLDGYIDFAIPNVDGLHIKITFNEIIETELPDAALTLLTTKGLAARLTFTLSGLVYGGHSTKQTK